jgi:pimeloyl-ACP methyl ester carboxylesterase
MRTLLPGVTAERVPTSRLTVSVLSVAGRTGQPVLFVHGNVSSSLFWQPAMLGLPEGCRPLAVDLRGFGDTDPEPVDATRGLGDYADDLAAVIDALALTSVHLVGWSMGGGVVLQYLAERPAAHRAASVTLVAPVSPFGFGRRVGRRLGAPRFRGPPGRPRPGRGEPCVTAAGSARALREAAIRSSRTGHLRGVDALDPDR